MYRFLFMTITFLPLARLFFSGATVFFCWRDFFFAGATFLPLHFILVISAVWISVPSIFCILKFLLIKVYLRSGTLIGLLLWLYNILIPFVKQKTSVRGFGQ